MTFFLTFCLDFALFCCVRIAFTTKTTTITRTWIHKTNICLALKIKCHSKNKRNINWENKNLQTRPAPHPLTASHIPDEDSINNKTTTTTATTISNKQHQQQQQSANYNNNHNQSTTRTTISKTNSSIYITFYWNIYLCFCSGQLRICSNTFIYSTRNNIANEQYKKKPCQIVVRKTLTHLNYRSNQHLVFQSVAFSGKSSCSARHVIVLLRFCFYRSCFKVQILP